MDAEAIQKLTAEIVVSIAKLNTRISESSPVDAEKLAGTIRNLAEALRDLTGK